MDREQQATVLMQSASAIEKVARVVPDLYCTVSMTAQALLVVKGGAVAAVYPVSTAADGAGNREGSLQTPPGVHRIAAKYGHGAPLFRIFRDRIDTGEIWRPDLGFDDFILTRIMWLGGLEHGVNRGEGIDSFDRYIYIHGTANEAGVGRPASHGCICMRNQDLVLLFDMVSEGTIVDILE